ncbi:MAG: hypothetical protein PHT94_05290 [Candidatus Nanoarchaeia archaeon]|nr:hypothetical protein [Candidatus Nanoarchaeia archaeon]
MNDDKKEKSTTISIRIPNDLLADIDDLVEMEGIDRPSWIKRALFDYLYKMNSKWNEETIEDYIFLKIDEKNLLENLNLEKVPDDLKNARKNFLDSLVLKKTKEFGKK